MKKKLIFSNLQNFNQNDKNNYYLGPWVFLGNENIEGILDKINFKNTFDNKNDLNDSKYLIDFSNQLVKKISISLNKYYTISFSYDYWKIIIGPSIIYFSQIMYEKFKLIEQLSKTEDIYECEILDIKVFPKLQSSRDVLKFLKSNYGNYFLMSLVIEEFDSKNIIKKYNPKKIKYQSNENFKGLFLDKFKLYSDLFLSLYTKSFIHRIKGINFLDKIILKSKKNNNNVTNKILEIEKKLKFVKKNTYNPKIIKEKENLFESLCEKYFQKFLPNFVFINFIKKNLKSLKLIKFFTLYEKKIVLGPVLGGNDTIKILIALIKELNVKIFVHQHGGYYGLTKTFTTMAFIEYLSADKFISWGWNVHSNYFVNAIPLPIPQITKIKKNNKYFFESKLLFIGTDMPIIYERFGTTPQPQEFIYYQKDKLKIIKNLSKKIIITYKPYFYNPSSLNDIKFFNKKNITINYLNANIEKNINKYDLILLDHPGTIMNICIGLNKPILIYINLSIWNFSSEIKSQLDELAKIGVVHYDLNSCSDFINHLFHNNLNKWWNLRETQDKLKIFRNNFAMVSDEWRQDWKSFLNEN